ncbi:DNA/RNA non-specific endonuclease family protein, partial [Vibrio parahaemolyticus V-223/04]
NFIIFKSLNNGEK